uniref:SAP domain-containing ribonucleoprotein n=1 Tax=Paramormyrops kingsleyae TaxID=1676925 RepID=A0A3B3RD50_9TELE
MAEVVELHKLKLAELKQECAARGLEMKGNKGDLIARLQAYLEEHGDEEVNEEEVLAEEPEVIILFIWDGFYANNFYGFCVRVPEKKLVKITPPSSLNERLQKRAERFNMPASTDAKKVIRAARFGLPVSESISTQGKPCLSRVSVEILKKRAQRFGMNVSSVSKKVEEDEKLKKRKERFGILTGAAAVGDDAEAKKRKRAERFGNV